MTDWITHVEAARRLGCTPGTVQQLLERGELERRPPPRTRGAPSVGSASVERLRPVLEAKRARVEERRRRRQIFRKPPDIEHVWLDTADVAALTGMSRRWVYKQIRTDRVPATHHGGQWWIRRDHAEVVAAARSFVRRADTIIVPER